VFPFSLNSQTRYRERIMIAAPSSPSRKNFAPPLIGAALGYIGGFLLLIGTLAAFVTFGAFSGGLLLSSSLVAAPFLSLGLVTSILILLSSSMLYNRPEEHFVWGWVILFFGLIGFGPWNFFGMYAIGSVLSIAGGFYGLAFQPYQVSVSSAGVPESGPTPASFLKNCIHCGASIPIAAESCTSCGKSQKRA
jgi:hypothetical protein